jgi:hypothetical protein
MRIQSNKLKYCKAIMKNVIKELLIRFRIAIKIAMTFLFVTFIPKKKTLSKTLSKKIN